MEQPEEGNQIKRRTMEQEEEETQIKRRRQQSSSSISSSFPLDLTWEILLRLPLKSVVRFRCVSKLWSSITTDRYFINSFETWAQSKRPSLLLCFRRANRLFVFSIPQDHSNKRYSVSSKIVERLHMTTYPKSGDFFPTNSVQGLICFQRGAKALIWNPTMRHLTTINKPEKSWKDITVFLGYDAIGRKHKVVAMDFNKTCDECRVLTLGSAQESWRLVKTNHNHCPLASSSTSECITGVVYYKAYLFGSKEGVIMSFDVRSEKFHVIKLQWKDTFDNSGTLTTYKGRLACVQFNYSESSVTLWTLKDAEKHDWSSINFPQVSYTLYDQRSRTSFSFTGITDADQRSRTSFSFTGITDAGEFVYVPDGFRQSFYVMYYNPKRKSRRIVEFKGIADDEFRLKHGLGNRRLSNIFTIPNHIESLMSL